MKKIIEGLEWQLREIIPSQMDSASWGYEEGVLLTGNEVKQIIEFFGAIEHIINSGKKNKVRAIERILEQE